LIIDKDLILWIYNMLPSIKIINYEGIIYISVLLEI